jgi:hypothetical protein
MSTHTERIEQLPVGLKRLWVGVLLAPGAWVVCEGLGYVLAARGCEPGASPAGINGAVGPGIVQIVVALITLVLALGGLMIALGNWRAMQPPPTRVDSPEWGRAHFLAFGGLLMSILFAGGIVLFGIAPLFINACSQAR